MEPRELLDALAVADRLKDTTRHCYTVGAGTKVWRSTAGARR